VANTAPLQAKSLGSPATDHRGLRVIHPPRSGYPLSGCSSAEPDSVSPDEATVDHAGPLSSDASSSIPLPRTKGMLP
jgi:hypothetical protein